MSNDNLPPIPESIYLSDTPVDAELHTREQLLAYGEARAKHATRAGQRDAVAASGAGVPEAAQQNGGLVRAALIDLLALERFTMGMSHSFDSQKDASVRLARARVALAAAPTPDRAPHASTAGEELSAGQERDAAPRFFMDHGLWHDRVTGQHMYTQDQYDEESRACLKEGRENGQEEAAVEAMKHAGGSTAAHAIRALRSTPAGAAVTGADHARLERVIACAEILNKRPRPMCRDCADEDGTCPNSGLDCDMRNLLADARDILAKSKGGA